MIGSVYNGMSGLLAFSKGLDTISSNISNMNTPGFKSSELQFLDVFYQSEYSSKQNGETSESQGGSGVATGGTTTRFNQGELRSTGQDLDVAIDGNGFFVIRKDNETLYTRAGQLQFDDEGYLITRQNGARIASLDAAGSLHDINQDDFLTMQQQATSEITFKGVLSTGSTTKELTDIKVFDTQGSEKTIRLEFTRVALLNGVEWQIEVFEAGNSLATGIVKYDSNGDPIANENTMLFTVTADDGTTSDITLNMGEPGDTSGSTSTSGGINSDNFFVKDVDGYTRGLLQSTTINADGVLVSEYSNGESNEHVQLAMALFLQLQDLEQQSGSVFSTNDDIDPTLGHANDLGFGSLRSKTVELSNVELTQQFGDLIIVQRGYQASSQILTVSNEMLQQLLEMRGR